MRRVMLDLKSDAGRDAFLRLAATADVVVESFRPGVIDRLGIGYDALRAANPGIVLCSTTGFGQTGPRAAWAGHDINYLAVSGYLHCSGRDERGAPALAGATIADSAGGGLQAVAAICAALTARATTGEGAHLDVSIADGVLSLMSLAVDEYLAEGVEPGPRHGLLTGRYAWYDLYEASDRGWLAVGATSAGHSAVGSGSTASTTTMPSTPCGPTSPPPSPPEPATNGPPNWGRPTPACLRCSTSPRSWPTSSSGHAEHSSTPCTRRRAPCARWPPR